MKFSVKYNVLVHPQNYYMASACMQPLYLRLVFRAK
jgi:hypothetical protein